MRLLKNQKNTTSKASMSLVSKGAIGVDISQNAIKMVQLSGRSLNQIQLEKYVITRLPKNIIRGMAKNPPWSLNEKIIRF